MKRLQKFSQLLTTVPRYVQLHHWDPTDLLYEEMMLDYVLSPEDKSVETVADWKLRMAKEQEMDGTQIAVTNYKKMVF